MDPEHRRESVGLQRGTRLPVPKSKIPHLGQKKDEAPLSQSTLQTASRSSLPVQSRFINTHRTSALKPPSKLPQLPMGPPSTPSSKSGVKHYPSTMIDGNGLTSPPTAMESTPLRTTFDTATARNDETAALTLMDDVIDSRQDSDFPVREKRRPRPSLSDRTIETLSALSPSPARNGRRPSMNGNMGARSPLRPASSLSISRPSSPSRLRPASPQKELGQQPRTIVPPVPRLSTVSNNSRLLRSPQVDLKASTREPSKQLRTSRLGSPSRLTTPQSFRTSAIRSNRPEEVATSSTGNSRPVTMKARSTLNPSGTTRTPASKIPSGKRLVSPKVEESHTESPGQESTMKSSAALREAIAAAKAARRKAKPDDNQTGKGPLKSNTFAPADLDMMPELSARGLLQRRLEAAVTTGVLNISAMSFTQIPKEVLTMYEPGNLSTPWSEMVDLVKLIAADNEIAQIQEDVFPDFTTKELEEDSDKTNQFFGLEILDLHNNRLAEIPLGLRRLERLRILNLNNNKLDNQSMEILQQIPNLTELHLAKNNLSGSFKLLATTASTLKILDITENKLEGFGEEELGTLRSLQVLKVATNRLKELPWSKLARLPLTEIDVSRNQLNGTITLTPDTIFDKLRTLDISHNTIETLSMDVDQVFPVLQTLSASTNRLKVLPDLSQCCLRTLLLAENGLSEFPDWLSRMDTLQRIDLGNNNFTTVDMAVATLDNLVYLNLVGNPLRERKYLSMSTSELKADLEKRLTPATTDVEIQLMPDMVSSRPNSPSKSSLVAINGVLDLSSRNLTTVRSSVVEAVATQTIRSIILARNHLISLPIELLTLPNILSNMQSLDLSDNNDFMGQMNDFEKEPIHLAALTTLSLASTGLSDALLSDLVVHYIRAPNLQTLNISNNNLTGALPNLRHHFRKLTAVFAANNSLTTLPTSSVEGLEILDIRNNDISHLPPKIGLLGNHPGKSNQKNRLRSLDCSGNKFRVPRLVIIEKGTEAILKDLRRMVPLNEVDEEWRDYL